MKLIVGLGNPEKNYQGTRHNVGHWLVERLFRACKVDGRGDKWLSGYTVKLLKGDLTMQPFNPENCFADGTGNLAILVKSDVFMNQSGVLVKGLVDEYRVNLNNLLVVHDDLDIPLGEFKLQKGSGAAGHKGVESVVKELSSKDFWRLRVGIGRFPEGMEAEEYVLREFTPVEFETLNQALPKMIEGIRKFTNNPNVPE